MSLSPADARELVKIRKALERIAAALEAVTDAGE